MDLSKLNTDLHIIKYLDRSGELKARVCNTNFRAQIELKKMELLGLEIVEQKVLSCSNKGAKINEL